MHKAKVNRQQAEDLKQNPRGHEQRREDRERVARRALELRKLGLSVSVIAQRFGRSEAYINGAMKELRESIEP